MYVWGFMIQTFSWPARPSASSAANLRTLHSAPSARASRSATRKPTLWRVRA